MRRITKVVLAIPALVAMLAVGVLAVLFLRFPAVGPPPEVDVAGTPEQVARGRYLAHHVTVCVDCHSQRDWSRFSAPVDPRTLGGGGQGPTRAEGFPGEVPVPNITPAGLAEWSDGEVMRAMTSGVARDGRPLFPMMPYPVYAHLSRPDAEAIVAYLRTLPPVPGEAGERELDFPLNLIVRTMPREAALRESTPAPGDPAYGAYLVTVAGCRFCHTRQDAGNEVPGMAFAGGHEFPLPSGVVVSANITPDPVTGIGGWSREAFVARFRAFAQGAPAVGPDDPNTAMPWTQYAGMTDEDLGAIYDHLRTVAPVRNAVEKWPARAAGGDVAAR
jgi:mono/diheme cytochrome c family protein